MRTSKQAHVFIVMDARNRNKKRIRIEQIDSNSSTSNANRNPDVEIERSKGDDVVGDERMNGALLETFQMYYMKACSCSF